jgi:hypothetical protein
MESLPRNLQFRHPKAALMQRRRCIPENVRFDAIQMFDVSKDIQENEHFLNSSVGVTCLLQRSALKFSSLSAVETACSKNADDDSPLEHAASTRRKERGTETVFCYKHAAPTELKAQT